MRKTTLIAIAVAASIAIAGCGSDDSDDTLATSPTTASTETTTTAATSSTTAASESTTTAAPSGSSSSTTAPTETATGKAVLTMSTGVTKLEISSCSSSGESSINLIAKDDDGDEIDLKARNDIGVVTYRGPQESREGTTVRVTVGDDKGFNVVGALNGEEFTLTGKCA